MALPWMAVPKGLTNNPHNTELPGDVGFDPLGLSPFSDNDFNAYLSEVCDNFGITFDKMLWYREAELMHGRVAMLATFNVVLRETPLTGVLPDRLMEQGAIWQFVQSMSMLEAFRGWRLLVNQEQIAGDLGLGAGPVMGGWKVRWDMTREELAERRYKELQNGRLAMLAFAGMTAQYLITGRAVGIDDQLDRLQAAVGTLMLPEGDLTRSIALTALGAVMVLDGSRRLSLSKDQAANAGMTDIAAKAINPLAISFGVQDPEVALPAGVVAGQDPQPIEVTEEQIVQFEEDGVIILKGAMKGWVDFLRAVTEFQIERPHVWSLVGRMSGMYDYIQRNTWMTNNGYRDFLYYSPLGTALAKLGRTEEVRCSTDMLLVNPNRGFGWHQDNQNGPIDFPDAMRWWVAMDACGQDDFGAPEYLLGSHRNGSVEDSAVFVNLEDGDLTRFHKSTKYTPEPGDLIIWNARTIHRIVAPPNQRWDDGTQRRALGGTVAKANTRYINKGGASGISDLAGHNQVNGDLLGGPYFPRIYPRRVPEEENARDRGALEGRSPRKIANLAYTLASNAGKYVSFTKVVGKKD